MSMTMPDEMGPQDFIRVLWRLKWWLILWTGLVMAVTLAALLQMPKTYRANAILVPPEVDQVWPTPDGLKTRFGAAAVGGAIKPGTSATDIVQGMLKSRRMAEAVIAKFDLANVYPGEKTFELPSWLRGDSLMGPLRSEIIETLRGRMEVRVTENGLLSLSVEDRDPKRAAEMVRFCLEELDRINLSLQTTYHQYMARVLDPPAVPDKPFKPRLIRDTALSGACAAFVWVACVVLWLCVREK